MLPLNAAAICRNSSIRRSPATKHTHLQPLLVMGENRKAIHSSPDKGRLGGVCVMARIYRQIDGVLLFDKPLELSSNTALQKVRRLFQAKKAGHTGTLDPLATGLLPICFG